MRLFVEAPEAMPERVTSHTVGVNWWPHSNVRVSLNYVYNLFEGRMHLPGQDVRNESAVLFRMQFGF
jgi:phosphate-selective porin